jgi:hypothetical protein
MMTFRIDPHPQTALGSDPEALDKPGAERIRRVPEPDPASQDVAGPARGGNLE